MTTASNQLHLLLLVSILIVIESQFIRPRFYCVEETPVPEPGTGTLCVNGDEYEVTRIVPNEGYVQMSGQTIGIFGANFPPQNVAELQCQVGSESLQDVGKSMNAHRPAFDCVSSCVRLTRCCYHQS